jgi:hypothetical protein
MSPEENTEVHVKARNNTKKLCLVMPQKKAEMNTKANNGMINLQLIMSHKKGRNEHERTQQDNAISLLLNLEAAQQGRSMLFSDKQKLLFKGGKEGLLRTPNWIL